MPDETSPLDLSRQTDSQHVRLVPMNRGLRMDPSRVYGRHPTCKEFDGLDRDHKQDILHQIANVFKSIQGYPLPDSVKGYRGLAFNESGEIVTGPTEIPCGGPFSEFHEMYIQMLRRQLIESDTSELIAGWH